MRKIGNVMITGGAGFIGSNLIRYILRNTDFSGRIINIDALTYAGNLYNLIDIEKEFGGDTYFFERIDIRDRASVDLILVKYNIDTIIHLAAESHVDRSITDPENFITTNINGTFNLLEAVRKFWTDLDGKLFHHVSTDEVYGSLDEEDYFSEDTPYLPRNPYSASKAASDHLVRAYHFTYNLPVTLSNCSNNYGPYQFPEKLIPLLIENMLDDKPLPIYGDGKNIRDWLYVEDHNSAIWKILNYGIPGQAYNIGGENEWENIKLANILCEIVALETGKSSDFYKRLINFVEDRPGHDHRYAIDCTRLKLETGWTQTYSFKDGLHKTVKWYLKNREWVNTVKTGDYLR